MARPKTAVRQARPRAFRRRRCKFCKFAHCCWKAANGTAVTHGSSGGKRPHLVGAHRYTIKPQPSLAQPTPCISCRSLFSSRPPQWLQQLGHWRSPKGVGLAHAQYAGPAGRVAAAAAAGGSALLPIGEGLGGAAAAASTGRPWRGALKRPFLAAGVGCRGGATASATRAPSPTCPGALKPELALETLPVLERLRPCRAPRPEAEPRAGGATGGAGRLAAARPGRPVRTLSAAVWKAGLAACRAPAPAAPSSASGSSASPKSQACWRLSISAFAGLARLMSTPCPVWKPPPPPAEPDCKAGAAPKPTAPSVAEPKPMASTEGPKPMPPAEAKPDCKKPGAAPKPAAQSAAEPKPTSAAGPKPMPPVSAEGSIGPTSRCLDGCSGRVGGQCFQCVWARTRPRGR